MSQDQVSLQPETGHEIAEKPREAPLTARGILGDDLNPPVAK